MQGQPLILSRDLESTKSNIKTTKDLCGTARHFNDKCCSSNNKNAYLKIQIIEQGFNNNQFSIQDLLWEREKYWQAQLFSNLYVINNINDLYNMKKMAFEKNYF